MHVKDLYKKLLDKNPLSRKPFSFVSCLYQECLDGKKEANIFAAPIDPGLGKSTSYKPFIADKYDKGDTNSGGIIIFLNTLEEVRSFISDCPIPCKHIAVLTSDDDTNLLCSGSSYPDKAFVLLTTKSMLLARTEKKTFSAAREFFFKGKPRTLRIWDESLAPAAAIHIACDELVNLYGPLRFRYGQWVEGLEDFVRKAVTAAEGTVLTVPRTFGTGAQFHYNKDAMKGWLDDRQVNAVQQLRRAAGHKVRIYRSMGAVLLVGAGDELPADLAPVVVFDLTP